ncbi:unnamed protein product [Dovyalis caffra]|uniref:Uncharacterized protein n=1 Tax=Dovyalis caffra TaxID=77055 RepID=A0AAV1R169_9ROSI|nr:unnamed protein product [Dovyalis caffra]
MKRKKNFTMMKKMRVRIHRDEEFKNFETFEASKSGWNSSDIDGVHKFQTISCYRERIHPHPKTMNEIGWPINRQASSGQRWEMEDKPCHQKS